MRVMCNQLHWIILHVTQAVLGRNTSCAGRNTISTAYNTKISSGSYSMMLQFERHIALFARKSVVGVSIRLRSVKLFHTHLN